MLHIRVSDYNDVCMLVVFLSMNRKIIASDDGNHSAAEKNEEVIGWCAVLDWDLLGKKVLLIHS